MFAWEGSVTTFWARASSKRTPSAASRSMKGVSAPARPYAPSASARSVSTVTRRTRSPPSRRTRPESQAREAAVAIATMAATRADAGRWNAIRTIIAIGHGGAFPFVHSLEPDADRARAAVRRLRCSRLRASAPQRSRRGDAARDGCGADVRALPPHLLRPREARAHRLRPRPARPRPPRPRALPPGGGGAGPRPRELLPLAQRREGRPQHSRPPGDVGGRARPALPGRQAGVPRGLLGDGAGGVRARGGGPGPGRGRDRRGRRLRAEPAREGRPRLPLLRSGGRDGLQLRRDAGAGHEARRAGSALSVRGVPRPPRVDAGGGGDARARVDGFSLEPARRFPRSLVEPGRRAGSRPGGGRPFAGSLSSLDLDRPRLREAARHEGGRGPSRVAPRLRAPEGRGKGRPQAPRARARPAPARAGVGRPRPGLPRGAHDPRAPDQRPPGLRPPEEGAGRRSGGPLRPAGPELDPVAGGVLPAPRRVRAGRLRGGGPLPLRRLRDPARGPAGLVPPRRRPGPGRPVQERARLPGQGRGRGLRRPGPARERRGPRFAPARSRLPAARHPPSVIRPSLARAALCGLVALVPAACRRPSPGAVCGDCSVLLVSIDTLRADRLPAYGYAKGRTPHLDELARRGILFEEAYSHCPLTLPAHASLLTGLLPPRHGVRDNVGFTLKPEHLTLAARFKAAGFRTGGAVSAYVLRRQTGIAQGFDEYDDALESEGAVESLAAVQRDGAVAVESLARWIDAQGSARYFAFLHLYEPHTPYAPPERFRGGDPYDGEVSYADELVGRLLDRLAGRERLIVAVTADHGEGLLDHGEAEHGIFLYREAVRVPLILRLPRDAGGGSRVPSPVAQVDVPATLLDLAGVSAEGLDGSSLRRALSGAEPSSRRVYSETFYPRYHFGWSELRAVTEGRFRFVQAPRPELFDLDRDPGERTNLAGE